VTLLSGPRADLPTAKRSSSGSLDAARLGRIVAHVEANLHNPLRVATLADIAALSPSHFSRVFKTTLGVNPAQYVRLRRLEAAQALMRTTTESLIAIALACGMADQSHLTRIFRQLVGMSPGRWRHRYSGVSVLREQGCDPAGRRGS
jgi:transcriptional regulator GlxA family with amidase domain